MIQAANESQSFFIQFQNLPALAFNRGGWHEAKFIQN
jgi:hypothetical protein